MKLVSNIITEELCNTVINIVLNTKEIIDDERNKYVITTKKGQGNFVTSIDKYVEEYLINSLRNILPQAGFVSEENEFTEKKEINWIIDPIDGTNNFLNGFDYTISVALQVKKKNIFGIVYSPSKDELYYGKVNKGAYKKINNGKFKRIHIKEYNKNEGIVLFGVPYNRKKSKKIFSIVNKLYSIASDLKRIGPASLDICKIAEGKGKLYVELDLEIWDISAGEIIINEAGGKFCKIDDLFLFGSKKSIEEAKTILL